MSREAGYELYYYFTYTRPRNKQLLIIEKDRLILQNEAVFPSQIEMIVSEGYINSSIGKFIPGNVEGSIRNSGTK